MDATRAMGILREMANQAATYQLRGKPDGVEALTGMMLSFIRLAGLRGIFEYSIANGDRDEQDRRLVDDMIAQSASAFMAALDK